MCNFWGLLNQSIIWPELKSIAFWAEEHKQFCCHSLGAKKKKNTICPSCLVPLWCFPCSQSFEAAGATGLPVGVEWGRDGVGYHAFQDVALRGHDVLDKEVGSLRDVQIVLQAGESICSQLYAHVISNIFEITRFSQSCPCSFDSSEKMGLA